MEFLDKLEIKAKNFGSSSGSEWTATTDQGEIEVISPINGQKIASVCQASAEDYEKLVNTAQQAFSIWRMMPAPKRGEIVRQIGLRLRQFKQPLGRLVTCEMGKTIQEGWGEVQEMIDVCDFAVGQSRQLYGFTMHSERPRHRMYEQYHPLGIVGVINEEFAIEIKIAPTHAAE